MKTLRLVAWILQIIGATVIVIALALGLADVLIRVAHVVMSLGK